MALRSLLLITSMLAACGSDAGTHDVATPSDTTVEVAETVTSETTATDGAPATEVAADVVVELGDRDCDGLADDEEAALGTEPDDADSDDDGLPDGLEHGRSARVAGTTCATFVADADPSTTTDPTVRDSDADGIDDGVEDADHDGRADPGETASHSSDSDCDGLGDAVELATRYAGDRRTDPNDADSDDDGLDDGLERGMRTLVERSACESIARDLQPSTTTDATAADSDRDGLADGCEDGNRNGYLDFGETDPQAFDSDGDQLGDALEDADGDCVHDADETSAARADTDLDGIGDGVERALGATDPRALDTDLDGVPDGVEDRDADGVVDADETDPNDDDSDGDGLGDGTEDTDGDGLVDEGESDPRRTDSDGDGFDDARDPAPASVDGDGDGLRDDAEDVDRDGVVDPGETDALDPDSDDDGVRDGEERLAGTDPLSSTDPTVDVGSGIAAVCAADAPATIVRHTSPAGDWTLALPTHYRYAPAATTDGDHVATFEDGDGGATRLAGFVLERAPSGASSDASAQALALLTQLTSNNGALGTSGTPSYYAGRAGTSHDGHATIVDIQVALTLASELDPSTLRNRVLAVLAGRDLDGFTGLPGPSGELAPRFILRFAVQVRAGTTPRVVVVGALASTSNYDDERRLELDDIADTNVLARAHVGTSTACTGFTVTTSAKVDFIWMADVSASTDNDRGRIANAAELIFDALALNGVDFRMGVVPSTENHLVDPSSPGQLRSGFTRSLDQFQNDLENTSHPFGVSDACEFGLTAMDDAIVRALPRTEVESPTKLRAGSMLVAFYISDETAQEIESAPGCEPPALDTGQDDFDRSLPPTNQQANRIKTIVTPFFTRIRNEGGVAFGQVLPVKAPFCSEPESGLGYVEVIEALRGSYYRTCDSEPGHVLEDMVDTIAAQALDLVLDDVPIAETLRVGITESGAAETTMVPRSATNGFAYDQASNAIFFRGESFRPGLGDRVTVSYRTFGPPEPPSATCPAPLVADRGTCVCAFEPLGGACGGDTCGDTEVCETDPTICGCRCAADCGGVANDNFECAREPTCGPVCADADDDGERDCNRRCGGNLTCTEACECACVDLVPGDAHDCNGLIADGGRERCDVASCAAVCPLDCGGCDAGRCDLATCSCVP